MSEKQGEYNVVDFDELIDDVADAGGNLTTCLEYSDGVNILRNSKSALRAAINAQAVEFDDQRRGYELAIGAAQERVDELKARVAELEEAVRWIPVEERFPGTMQRVNVLFKIERTGKLYLTMAEYIAPRTVLAEDYLSEECCDDFVDYDDVEDTYWTPTGWYEYQYESEINYFLSSPVVYWMPISPKQTEATNA